MALPQENGTAVTPEHHAHEVHDAVPQLAEGQRWETDAPLREAMLRTRDGVSARIAAFHNGTFLAAEANALAAAVDANVQFMIANCQLAPEPDAALHLLIGRMLAAAGALRIDPESAEGLPQLVAVLHDYGATFDHSGWEPVGS
jgi:hypothetical protein